MKSQGWLNFLLRFNASQGQALVDAQVYFQKEKGLKVTALFVERKKGELYVPGQPMGKCNK